MANFKRTQANAILIVLFSLSWVSGIHAGEIGTATKTLDMFLRKDGGSAVSRREKCGSARDRQYVTEYKVAPINDRSTAVSVFTMLCPIGNSTDQYLMIVYNNGKGRVVANKFIGDMKFKGGELWVSGSKIVLEGVKWAENDAHCCPSVNGRFEYDIPTGEYNFIITKPR